MKKVLKCMQEKWISISSYLERKGMAMPKKVTLILFLIFIGISPLYCDPPAGYYDSANGLTGDALRLALHNIIKNHNRISYDKVKDVVAEADEDPDNPSNILDIYKNESYDKTSTDTWSREHAWPKSYGFPPDDEVACNYPYTDCHHIFACDTSYNTSRGKKFYDDCLSDCTSYFVNGFPEFANYANSDSWEVWLHRRGDVARALFYMDVRYEGGINNKGCAEPDLILTNDPTKIVSSSTNQSVAYMGILDTLLKWNDEDPVDDRERHRNDVVYNYQGNRNPFIDHPEWVQAIWNPGTTPTPSPTQTATPTPTPIVAVSPGDIVINEINYDDPGVDTYTFIELKNVSHKTIDLSSIEVVGLNNSSTVTYFTYKMNSHSLAPGEYWVLGTTTDSTDVADYVNETMTGATVIQNGLNDGVFLRLSDPPNTIIDSVSYDGDGAHPVGSLDTGNAGIDNGVGLQSLSRIPDGSDTNDNAVDFKLMDITPGSANSALPTPTPTQTPTETINAGDIIINEIDYDNPGKDTQSFIELKNKSDKTIDLSSIEVLGLNNSTTATYFTYHPNSHLLAPGEYWVLGTKDDSTSITTFINETMTGVSSLQNGPNDGIYLRLKNAPATIIDSVSYSGNKAHPVGSPDSGNAGTDSSKEYSKSLSRIPDGRDTNDNAVDFILIDATPGSANSASPAPGTCGILLH